MTNAERDAQFLVIFDGVVSRRPYRPPPPVIPDRWEPSKATQRTIEAALVDGGRTVRELSRLTRLSYSAVLNGIQRCRAAGTVRGTGEYRKLWPHRAEQIYELTEDA